ncbi:FAD-dependent oxidoreductase [Actinoplanes subtropicus]|uniref:FAD-dependent oxidoreductase n=1 Tax=Actinoplanes subtropicus TaxID=543632 RepID=UPI0004C3846A|nr:FAD-dependent oxidoreductase [Actinoplanes subtropicus]
MVATTGEHALVLGGSIGGLLAARVLADRYTTVTIIEKDHLPGTGVPRRGVPHGHHVHAMLPRGLQVIEDLLPGFTARVTAAGGLTGDILANVRWNLNGLALRRKVAGLTALSASRPLLEGTVREQVRALPNVKILEAYDVTGLRTSEGRDRITGAAVARRDGSGASVLAADLVVDATGRGSRTPRWLAELGYESPSADRVGIDLAYSSCLVTAPGELMGDDLVVVTARYPGQLRSSVMQRLEGGRILLTLAGVRGERPPLAYDELPAYARTLATADTYDLLRAAKPLGAPVAFRFPAYVRYRYDQLRRLPAGLLVTGDATCGFNPVYGQGMSVAAMNAAALAEELSHGAEPDPYRYFQAVARALEAPWRMAVGADLALPGVTGPALPDSPLTPDYLRRLQLAATEDAEVAAALVRVTSLVEPPPTLLRPEIVARVERFSPIQAILGG